MEFIDYFTFFACAALGGAINSVAGGGTFLTFPVLIWAGLTPLQANVTSTIALWPGSVASAAAYRQEWRQQKEILPALMAISIAGSALGAAILLLAPERVFESLVPWLLLAATLIFTFGRRAMHALKLTGHPLAARVMQFAVAVYGGYFGAGIGILMLAMLQLMGLHHIHRMNALKTVLGSTINAVAVFVFVAFGAVVWPVALVMVAGAIAGGYVGAWGAQKLPPEPVRWMVSGIGFATTAYFFLQ